MKILAIADVESKYLWDYFEKSKLEGIDLIISCGDLDPHYLSWLRLLRHRYYMSMETMTINTKRSLRTDVSASMIRSMYMKAYGSWDWAVL